MKFEIAKLDDIDKLCELLNLLFEQEKEFKSNKELQTKALRIILEDNNLGHILIAKDSDDIVGMVNLLYSVSTALGSKVAILEDMVVKKEYQNKNIGSNLLSYAKEFAKKQACKRITLLTDNDNLKAHSFYEKNGFEKSSMIPFRIML